MIFTCLDATEELFLNQNLLFSRSNRSTTILNAVSWESDQETLLSVSYCQFDFIFCGNSVEVGDLLLNVIYLAGRPDDQ